MHYKSITRQEPFARLFNSTCYGPKDRATKSHRRSCIRIGERDALEGQACPAGLAHPRGAAVSRPKDRATISHRRSRIRIGERDRIERVALG